MLNLNHSGKTRNQVEPPAKGVRKRTASPSHAPSRGSTIRPRSDFLSPELRRAIFLKSEVVRTCATTPIEFISTMEWAIVPKDSKRTQILKDHYPERYEDQQKRIDWATVFFERPNYHENFETFLRRWLLDLALDDDAFFEIVYAEMPPAGDRLPVELGVIPSATVEIDCDDQGMPLGFQQSYNVIQPVYYENNEVGRITLHPTSWSPYGTPKIDTAIFSVMNDLNALQWNAAYFEKDGVPPGILAIMGVTKEEYVRISTQMRTVSRDNPHNIHSIWSPASGVDGKAPSKVFDYIPLHQLSQREMQFAELLTAVAGRIAMQFNLNLGEIGFTQGQTGGIGNGIAEQQNQIAQSKGVAPISRAVSSCFTHNVLHEALGWTDLEFQFVRDESEQKREEFQKDLGLLQHGAKTINEIRIPAGLPPVDWGDLPLQYPQGFQFPQQQQQFSQGSQQGFQFPQQQQGGFRSEEKTPALQELNKSAKRITFTL